MDVLLLTMRGQEPAMVVPRRLSLHLDVGSGDLVLDDVPDTDAACRQSLTNAWRSACQLSGRGDVDGRVSIAGSAPVHGWSAGASFGLLALTMLLGEPDPLPDLFATGAVMDDRGTWGGGAAVAAKAVAARDFSVQLGMKDCRFFSPPITDAPGWSDLPVVVATDLGSAYARMHPDGYASIQERHHVLRRIDGPDAGSLVDGPFVVVTGPGSQDALPPSVDGIRVIPRPPVDGQRMIWVELGVDGRVLWRVERPDVEGLEEDLPGLWALAKRHSVM